MVKQLVATNAFFRFVPIAASAAFHVTVFATVGGGHGSQAPPASPSPSVLIDLVEIQREEELPLAPAAPNQPRELLPTHRHHYPLPAIHDARPHDSSLVHVPVPTTASPASPAEAPAVVARDVPSAPRFTIALGNSAQTSRVVASGAQGTRDLGTSDFIVPESGVSIPARLQSVAPAAYPPSARSSEIEADVLVEIVVDAGGRVIDAKPLRHAGYGFDELALKAVRKYRFSPAKRNGQAVRVRMRWVVQFRLN